MNLHGKYFYSAYNMSKLYSFDLLMYAILFSSWVTYDDAFFRTVNVIWDLFGSGFSQMKGLIFSKFPFHKKYVVCMF